MAYKLYCLLLYAVAFSGAAAADDLSDFSNNLATDLGPLLTLFGDSITKQYLSESTSFLDYLIFAMAPIGIITAIVSTIRVCGHSSLRAFIGRSQEGDGVIEAELCTSTSRDVCELFNRGGITRVLGQPRILELVHTPGRRHDGGRGPPSSDSAGKDDMKLDLSQSHFEQVYGEREHAGWRSEHSLWERRMGAQDRRVPSFAPNPNLSLNVGIIKQPRWVFLAIAATGVVLQAGILAFAGVGVWVLHWNLDEGGDSASRDYAPIMFIAGTVLLCSGMWSCAFLIGQTTHEYRFQRTPQDPAKRSRLLWLQPGPQRIGDQNFDPFAYCEDAEKDPLQSWMTSRKDFNEKKFELYTFFAVLAVLIGYIMQFIGLRGVKAWVSLAQLGITGIMSILRGCLRMQRLDRNANKLQDMPDLVSGHELDWLSFEMAQQKPRWHVTGQHGPASEVQGQEAGSTTTSRSQGSLSHTIEKDDGRTAAPLVSNDTQFSGLPGADNAAWSGHELLQIRVRLAHLTGHIPLDGMKDSEYQKWEDDYIKVRVKAVKIAAAIRHAVGNLLPNAWQKDIVLRIQAASLKEGQGVDSDGLVDILLKPPPAHAQASWRMDSAQLEAVLGLWMWSLVLGNQVKEDDNRYRQTTSLAEKARRARIVSAGLEGEGWVDQANSVQGEMDLWLGPSAVRFLNGSLSFQKSDGYGLAALWQSVNGGDEDWERISFQDMASDATESKSYGSRIPQRFCGWNPVHGVLEGTSATEEVKLRVQIAQLDLTNISLLDLCGQELFTALMVSLTGLLRIDRTAIVESAGTVRLENASVRTLADAFLESGLGSYSDALLCIVPALRNHLSSPDEEHMFSALIQATNDYRQKSEWERAQTLMRWACHRFAASYGREADASRLLIKTLRMTGELYRWALAQSASNDIRRGFGIKGMKWMAETYRKEGETNAEVQEILDCYYEIAGRFSQRDGNLDPAQGIGVIYGSPEAQRQLVQAIKDRNRTDALYNLCFVSKGVMGSKDLQPALPLAVRNDWREVVDALWEMDAHPDNRDDENRTAISHCAEHGHGIYVEALFDRGASLDLPDRSSITPLHWAIGAKQEAMVKWLLENGNLDLERKNRDLETPLWAVVMKGLEAAVPLILAKGVPADSEDSRGRTLISWAAKKGQAKTVQALLDHGVCVDSQDRDGETPLRWAARTGNLPVVRVLVDRGANINFMHPIVPAIEEDHESIVEYLLDHGANVDFWNESQWMWRLYKERRLSITRRLLDHGANVNIRDGDGHTPLWYCAYHGYEELVQLFIERGADVELHIKGGWTPLHLTAVRAAPKAELIVQLLLDRGANIEAKDGFDRTPLLMTMQSIRTPIPKVLLERGANPNAKSKDGQTPLSIAISKGYQSFIQLLQEYGAV